MKKAKNVSKALMKAAGVAVLGSVIACGAALMAMHEGFKTAGNIVKRATEDDSDETDAGENVEKTEQTAEYSEEEKYDHIQYIFQRAIQSGNSGTCGASEK